jgi:hypothetical protein
VLGVALAGLLDEPFDYIPQATLSAVRGTPVYRSGDDLTPSLYAGLTWLRENTPAKSVVAVSNYYSSPGDDGEAPPEPVYAVYTAFGERRSFLGGWGWGPRALALGYERVLYGAVNPFPERLRLNEAVFREGDRGALATIVRRYGVGFLLVDKVHSSTITLATGKKVSRATSPRVERLGRRVFANEALEIYDVRGAS